MFTDCVMYITHKMFQSLIQLVLHNIWESESTGLQSYLTVQDCEN